MSQLVQKLVLLLLVSLLPLSRVDGSPRTPDSLKILSWNVYLLPNPPFFFRKQDQRCAEIIPILRKGDWDVVVLQEVFMQKHLRKIVKSLKDIYPYHYGPIGHSGLLKQSSGVLVLSRLEAICVDSILFEGECSGGDCFAKKGALFMEFEKGGKSFQVLGTHMQSGASPFAQAIRNDQYRQIRHKLLDPNRCEEVPQFLVGDLNTDQKGSSFRRMLRFLSAQNSSEGFPVQYTYDTETNCLASPDDGQSSCRQVLDYILFRHNRSPLQVQSYAVRPFRKRQKDKILDLADHFAVESVFLFGGERLIRGNSEEKGQP